MLAGEFTPNTMSSNPAPPAAGQPTNTLSQMVSYIDAGGQEVARVHQYLRPDGTIGAKGRPDPKRLLENGVLYRLHKGNAQATPAPATRFARWTAGAARIYMTIWGPIRCRLLHR